jgi:hypothetical protein
MVNTLLNIFAREQEIKYHRPIYNEIIKNLKSNIFTKITYSNSVNLFVKTTYNFYDSDNYLIFKLHISSIFDNDKRFFIDVEFSYSSNNFYYWTQLNNPILKLDLINPYNHDKIKYLILLIKIFIQTNLQKNNYINQHKLENNNLFIYYNT